MKNPSLSLNFKKLIIFFLILYAYSCSQDDESTNHNTLVSPNEEVDQKSNTIPESQVLEIGGSNYPMFDVSGYLNNKEWNTKNLQLTVGEYHVNPALIRSQLQKMYDSGQRKIALPIWFNNFASNVTEQSNAHTVRANSGKLTQRHRDNLKKLIREIKKTGFLELIIRTGAQGISSPKNWSTWNQEQYNRNWNYIQDIIKVTESELKNSKVRSLYDLGIEMGGITKGQSRRYVRNMWKDFKKKYKGVRSYGFSIAYEPGRLNTLIQDLKLHGLPNQYGIDLYKRIDTKIPLIKKELQQNNVGKSSIIIQECYYNNQSDFNKILRLANEANLKIRTILHWPIEKHRVDEIRHFSINFPRKYDAFLKPYVYQLGRGCSDRNCIWILGQNFLGNVVVQTVDPKTNKVLNTYNKIKSNRAVVSNGKGQRRITFTLKTQKEKSLINKSTGLTLRIFNPVAPNQKTIRSIN